MKPYDVGKEKGITYQNRVGVPDTWGDEPKSIAYMQAKGPCKTTTVDSIVILNAPEGKTEDPEQLKISRS